MLTTPLNPNFSAVAHYVNEYQRVEKNLIASSPASLRLHRKTALDNFTASGFPTRKHADWKYTPLTTFLATPFSLAPSAIKTEFLPSLEPTNNMRLVFVNGLFSQALSHLTSLPNQCKVSYLADIIKNNPEHLFQYWQTTADTKNSFIDLNTAFFQDGAYIYLAADTKLASPIELVFITTAEQNFIPVRNIIIAEKNSRAVIIEKYISLNNTASSYFTNTVSECFLNPQSQLEHYKLIAESEKSTHIGHLCVNQQQESQLSAYSIVLKGGLVRNDTQVKLAQAQAHCQLKSLYYAQGKQHIDQQTSIDHISPFTTSKEFYKGLIADQARAVFNGKVTVRPQAIKSKAEQLNKNLLLSRHAEVNSKPQLEIFADDIQCTHGASIGQLDETALFYLRARGIDEKQAHALLIKAFVQDIIQQMPLLISHPALSPSLKNLFDYASL